MEEWDSITVEEIKIEISRLPHVLQRCIECNGSNNFHGLQFLFHYIVLDPTFYSPCGAPIYCLIFFTSTIFIILT